MSDAIDMEALRHLSECEAGHRNPAAFEEMFILQRAGLVVCSHAGWGHYEVTITPLGRQILGDSR